MVSLEQSEKTALVLKYLCQIIFSLSSLGPKFKTHIVQKRQKLLGTGMYLEKGDVVTEIEPEDEDGYL